jgi:large subunit ribosomal protein L5
MAEKEKQEAAEKPEKTPKAPRERKADKPVKKVEVGDNSETPGGSIKVPPRMKERFKSTAAPKIKQQFGITNPMALPKVTKVIVNVGLGKSLEGSKLNLKAKEQVIADLTLITGQKPIMLRAKKSVSNFKLREGYEVGCMVTLRGARMWEFLDRLFNIAIPRIKDFRGLKVNSFDGQGNYTFGVNEQGIFPEINMAESQFTHGMHITIGFANSTPDKSRVVLTELGLPFAKPEERKRSA